MADDIDYRSIEIPEGKHPHDYSYEERRAEILQLIEQAGHPRGVNQTRLADRYDRAQSTISDDISILREYIRDQIDERTVDSITETVYQKAIQELIANEEYMEAVRATEKWNNWLFDRGMVEKEPDKHEHEHDATEAYIQNLKQSTASAAAAEDESTGESESR